jgi:hypothetical protein
MHYGWLLSNLKTHNKAANGACGRTAASFASICPLSWRYVAKLGENPE